MAVDNEEWLTLAEAADALRVTKMTLYKMRRKGLIKDTYPMGKPEAGKRGKVMVRVSRAEIDRFMTSGYYG